MISVGSRDARKGLGLLGFGVEGGEMEETELEEGEAAFHNHNHGDDDDDATIDPDVALSYIDEKLHDVLGHFQKDFEGGVSAENLGAKFGGYGSFLPTYQRSPAWTHPKSPPRVQNHNASISPSNLHVEGGRQNSVISSIASQLARAGPSSANAQSVPARGPPANDTAKREVCLSSTRRDEDFSSKGEPVKKFGNASDQKTLKVRIKMGSDNLSTRKNAEICSWLGLDVTPSSSLECSPIDSEGFSREPLDAPYESPTSILQIMTSSPVHGSLLLSPLPYEFTCLTEKEKLMGDRSGPMHKWSQVSTVAVVNGSDSDKVDQKVSGEKKLKPLGSNLVSAESMNSNVDDAGNNHVTKKETDMDTLACEELVSNALRLPLLSNSNCDVVDLGKGIIKADNILTVGNNGGMLPKEESLEPVFTRENGQVEKPSRRDTSVKKWENKKVNSDDEGSVYSVKGGKEADVSVKADSSVSKIQKGLNSEPIDHVNPKAAEKATSLENDRLKLAPVKETSSYGGKRKSKGSQSHSAQHAEAPKDSSKKESSVSKSRKSTYVNGYMSKSDVEDSKKDSGITKETYREFFGDLELEQEDSEMALEEKPFGDTPKESAILEKSTLEVNGGSKARLDGKRNQKPSMPVYPRPGSHMAPVNCNGPVSDAAATVTPVVKEDWVCCDKCQKWRLLPLGTNPDSLPENWLCSMLNWLPGMNRCSISEEETTKALIALYHVPGPENLSSVGGILPGVFAADPLQFDQKYQHLGSRGLPAGGKKKHGSKDAANETKQDCLAQPSNPIKKNLQTPVKGMGLNGVYQSPTMNGVDLQDSSQSKSLVVDKHRQKQKEKIKEKYMDGGEHSKIRNKRDTDQDGSRVGKKIKTDGGHYADEDWASDHGGAHLKGRSSSSGLSINVSGRDHRKSKELSDDSKSDSKGSVRNQEHQNQITPNDGSLHMRKSDERDVAKKRKLNDYQDSQIYNKSLPSVGRDLQESSETNRRKEKKARVSKSRGEETCASKDSGGADKRGRSIKDEQVGSLDAIDSSKRDTGSVAATSSSSKVSGSHKTKANPLEVKGSPVESVSSSPLRTLNPDKFTVTKGSDGEDDRGSYQTVRKGETLPGANGSLGSSVLDFQERDLSQALGNKVKTEVLPSPEFASCHVTDGDADTLGQGGQYGSRPETLDEDHNEERWNEKQGHSNGSRPRKPGKASSSRSKDKSRSSRSEYDKVNLKVPDSSNEYEENSKAGRNKLQDKFSLSTDKVEKGSVSKKESSGKLSSENVKRDSYSKYGRTEGSDVKKEAISGQDAKQNLAMDRDGEKSLKRAVSDKTDRADVPGRGKSHSLPPSGRGQNETARLPQAVPGSRKENGGISSSIDASEGNDSLRAPKQNRKAENQIGNQPSNTRHSTPNRPKGRDHDAPSPLRRDSASQAATNALKEATDLKHLADRLKNSGSHLESTGYYFQAVLKFLLGASLLESCNSESTKHVDMYSSTANLCEYCAREYEKSRDMAGAALAYKCTEVAYLKVVYSSHSLASKDRHELQTALQIAPTGESPSSSASDLDNLNNPATVDKVALAKGVSPPQIAGNHVIAARNRPNFTRLLTFARNVNLAMEASRKSRIAFAAVISKPEDKEAISSVKKALDFNFQDVDGLLRLVRLAMEAISR